MLTLVVAACGDKQSVRDYYVDASEATCARAFECRDSYPGGAETFAQVYGDSEATCVDRLVMVADGLGIIEDTQASVDAGRVSFETDDGDGCVTMIGQVTCDALWSGMHECDPFVGHVALGDACTIHDDCADAMAICDEVTLVCALPPA